MKVINIFFCVIVLFLVSCSNQNQDPDFIKITVGKAASKEDIQVERARQAWRVLADKKQKERWTEAATVYNDALSGIVDHVRREWKKVKHDKSKWGEAPYSIVKPELLEGKWAHTYEDIVPCHDVETDGYLHERVFVEGIGVPLAGVVKSDVAAVQNNLIKDNGNIHTLTAILDFDKKINGKPVLKVIPRLREDSIKVGESCQPLAADFTAPIYLFCKKSHQGHSALLGMFNPKKVLSYKGLYFSEPYDPDKIPVLFTHGLMSSPLTFANLANRLYVDPVIRKNYQFWYFSYPSGVSWLVPARDLRESLDAVYAEYDPHNKDANLKRMVWVGHSMGGLITRLNNATKPWALVPSFVKNSEHIREAGYAGAKAFDFGDEHLDEKVSSALIFPPTNRTKRIVFMATPHKGSDFANRWFGALGQKMIRLPKLLLREITRMGTLSSDMLLINPNKIVMEFTSIGQLSPDSPAIKGIQYAYPDSSIKVHSIIGDQGFNDTPNSSDGVVRYRSSHIKWAESEKIVPAGHSVQADIATAEEMRRILREHLKDEGISTNMPEDSKCAPTIWQDNPEKYYFRPLPFR